MTINNHTLYSLCIDNDYFTCGDNTQYNKLFEANKLNAPIKDIATIIWICSDENIRRIDVIDELKKARKNDIKYGRS